MISYAVRQSGGVRLRRRLYHSCRYFVEATVRLQGVWLVQYLCLPLCLLGKCLTVILTHIYLIVASPPGGCELWSIVMSVTLCLFVSLFAGITRKSQGQTLPVFVHVPMAVAVAVFRYVMYFRFCWWRHVLHHGATARHVYSKRPWNTTSIATDIPTKFCTGSS